MCSVCKALRRMKLWFGNHRVRFRVVIEPSQASQAGDLPGTSLIGAQTDSRQKPHTHRAHGAYKGDGAPSPMALLY